VVLVLRALGLGDLLTAVPALRGLRDAFPDHRIVLAAPATLRPLALLSGAVDEILPAEPLQPLPPLPAAPGLGVNLHGRGPQSHRVLLAAQPGRLIAFRHADVPESTGMPDWRPREHEVARWCRLLRERGVPADPARLDLPAPPVALPPRVRGATVIHPGAASAARRWPPARWAAVARAERRRAGRVIVTGGPGEAPLARRIAADAGLPGDAVLAGRTDLLELAALLAAAGRVASGDTGVAHLAVAVGTPSVTLFGPVPPAEWGPPADRPRHLALWAGRTGDPHGSEPDPGLLAIGTGEVIEALAALP
jgi:ADP-heptose:LPS heptosyltransferase